MCRAIGISAEIGHRPLGVERQPSNILAEQQFAPLFMRRMVIQKLVVGHGDDQIFAFITDDNQNRAGAVSWGLRFAREGFRE